MRTDKEIMDLILNAAKSDDRVLAAYLKGSRCNPNVPEDRYRDFDVMYVVRETSSFMENRDWINAFGNVILMQEQDDDFGYGERFGIRQDYDQSYSWLLLFDDGSRIDIGVETPEMMKTGRNRNLLFLPLLDKIGCLPASVSPTDREFRVKKPSEKRYTGCCKEFFWTLCDVRKGMARDELPFVMTTFYTLTKPMLEKMLEWHVGCITEYSVSCGKMNKFFKKYLSDEIYKEYLKIFSDADYSHIEDALMQSCELFRKTACLVAESEGFTYPRELEEGYRHYTKML